MARVAIVLHLPEFVFVLGSFSRFADLKLSIACFTPANSDIASTSPGAFFFSAALVQDCAARRSHASHEALHVRARAFDQ